RHRLGLRLGLRQRSTARVPGQDFEMCRLRLPAAYSHEAHPLSRSLGSPTTHPLLTLCTGCSASAYTSGTNRASFSAIAGEKGTKFLPLRDEAAQRGGLYVNRKPVFAHRGQVKVAKRRPTRLWVPGLPP